RLEPLAPFDRCRPMTERDTRLCGKDLPDGGHGSSFLRRPANAHHGRVSVAQGTCESAFEPVRDALGALIDSEKDVGACAAVVHEGKLVADVWAGHTDEARTTPWERDTIINVWSTTKTMTN